MIRHISRNVFFFKFLNKAIFLKILPKKVKKHDFLPKNHFFGIFWHFLVTIFKYCLIQKFEKLFLEKCLNMISHNFSIFSLSHFLPKKWFLAIFSKKSAFFGQIWYQKRILWLISIPGIYTFIYITVIIRKLQHAVFFTISGLTRPLSYRSNQSKCCLDQ